MRQLRIEEHTAGGRMDKAVMKYLDKAPVSFIYKMLRKKNILLNSKKAKGDEILKAGDVIELYFSEDTFSVFRTETVPQRKEIPATSLPAEWILYEDEHILAVNKPAGLLSQKAAPGDISLNEMLAAYLKGSDLFTPGISNRLDRNTSGIILAGKSLSASRQLNDAIKNRRLTKLYWCLVKGKLQEDLLLSGFLQKDKDLNQVRITNSVPKGQERQFATVQTAIKPLCANDGMSLLEIDLITGKTHQIRAHLASIDHPLIGDPKYGDPKINQNYRREFGLKHQLLHARSVQFTGMEGLLSYLNGTCICCPLPALFEQIRKKENLCLPGDQED